MNSMIIDNSGTFGDPELTPEELALRWRLSTKTLATWRSKKWRLLGKGIDFNKRGRKVTYYLSKIVEYEAKNNVNIGE